MTFSTVVWKMAKANHKKYLLYFLCNSFTVMFFYMFSSVFFNERVIEMKEINSLKYVLAIPGVALIVFTIFFIQYAYEIFIKSRKSEFGLFMSIGMSNRDIGKLLLIESLIISATSVITGILGGVVFSRLFFLLLMSLVGLNQVPYQITADMFGYSILLFSVIYWLAVLKSYYAIVKQNHLQNLKSDQVAETIKTKNPLYGLIGLMILVISIVGLYVTYGENSGLQDLLYMWAFTTFFGLYLCISSFTSFLIALARNYPTFYYSKMLLLTNIEYKLKRLSAIITLVTVMVMVTIFYSSIQLYTADYNKQQIIEWNPFDIAFIETDTKNKLSNDELVALLDKHDVTEYLMIPTYEYYEQEYAGWHNAHKLMSVRDFNTVTSRHDQLGANEFIYFMNEDENTVGEGSYPEELSLRTVNGEIMFVQKELVRERVLNYIGNSGDFIIVNDQQFQNLQKQMEGFKANLHFINVEDWTESDNLLNELENKFAIFNASSPPLSDIRVENRSEEDYLEIVSKIERYQVNKTENGILFFITTFLSIIFFFGSFILLYLNLFSDIEKEKIKYKKLYRIGISMKEIKRVISLEISFLFFMPTFVGAITAFLYIISMAREDGGILENPQIVLYFMIIACMYHIIQFGFYLYARNKMIGKLTVKNGSSPKVGDDLDY